MKKPERLPSLSEDFSRWYNTVVQLAGLAEYGMVRGTMVFKPYGYALWKSVMRYLGKMIEDLGVSDVYFPMMIPYSLLKKESEHVEGFAPEVAVITHAGGEELQEPLVVRPTSETIMYAHFKNWIRSYRDLPLKINQWCNVVRWEKRTVPFLRTTEFLWQEGHTAHATESEAAVMVREALDMYDRFAKQYASLHGIKGYKTKGEKFAGAVYTTTIETLLRSKKALQLCTSHMLGENFAKAFEIQYLDKNNKLRYVWQTSWGLSTRFLGAVIGHHGDDYGLVLPPYLAPVQVVIIPIIKKEANKEEILKTADILEQMLRGQDIRVFVDRSDHSVGYKFNEWDIKGVPLRIEIGDEEVRSKSLTVYLRVTRERKKLMMSNRVYVQIKKLLSEISALMYERSKAFIEENTHEVKNMTELEELIKDGAVGFIKVWFKDDQKVADMLQDRFKITPRVIPFETYDEIGNDFITGEKGARITLFAKAY